MEGSSGAIASIPRLSQQAFAEWLLGSWHLLVVEDTAGHRTTTVPAFLVGGAAIKPQGSFQSVAGVMG